MPTNPAVTLTFWRLGKVASWDALFYAYAVAFLLVMMMWTIINPTRTFYDGRNSRTSV